MNTVQSTIYGLEKLIALLLGQTPVIDAHSSMNERLDILANAQPTATEKYTLGIMVAGNMGHETEVGVQGIPLTSIVDHMATNASLYGPMPFCMRLVDNDIDAGKRAKYALRKILLGPDNQNYYAYYGLRITTDLNTVKILKKKITTEPGSLPIEEIFVPSSKDMYPDPVTLPNTGAVTTTDVKVSASALLPVLMNADDIEEYVNCAKILYKGDERYAIWSEFALCLGANRVINVDSTAGQVPFLESVGTQIYTFAADYKAVYYNSQELSLVFDVGCQVPLLGTMSIPTLETIGN